ncbi:UMP kinase [Candidatus Micrarchaeota archaeon]|nr:UMP kinase [Candidatus Micrarchaeota archaeon]
MEPAIISLGGSVLFPGKGRGRCFNPIAIDEDLLFRFGDLLKKIPIQLGIVVGGGAPAREYISIAKRITDNPKDLDRVGIEATITNAQLVAVALNKYELDVNDEIPRSIEEAVQMFGVHKCVVMGGTEPGQTTDAVAVKLAVASGIGKVINISRADAIYSEDPTKNPNAKRFRKMNYKMLEDVILKSTYRPGQKLVFDQLATTLARAHNIELHFVGTVDDLEKALLGKRHNGTVVKENI